MVADFLNSVNLMYFQPYTYVQKQAIYKEFSITDESLDKDVSILKEWMGKQPHLPKEDGKAISICYLKLC